MALIISIDVLQTVLVLVKLHQRISRIFSQLQQVEGNTNSKNNLLSQICSLCRNSFNKEAKEAIRRHSCIPHQISVEDTIFLASSGPLVDEEHKRFRINPPVNVVVPLDAAAFTFGKLGQNHCSSRDRLQTIEKSLEVLFTSEFVVLTEYLEAIIPIFYGIFVLVMVHLPSARYHIELAGITCENVINIIQKLSLYALLEILSFIMLAVMMKRICKLRMLHHVAFVLETQMALIQIKMITWMLMTMSFPTQVSHRGKYSIERLLALEEYSRKASLLRVLAVCAGTPLTIIVVVFSQGTLPLADPKDGWQANWGFWIRTSLLSGVTSVAVAVQLKYLVQGIDISSLQMILLSLSMALGYTGVSILVASLWVFPIPYMILSMMLPFLLLFVGATRVLFGSSTFQEILKKRKGLLRFVTAVSIQVLMAVCYPAYQLLFNTIAGSAYELPTFLLLPVIKMVLKNFVSLCLAELADLIPENIIFTVHFFNAIYLATSMQSAASTIAIATIMFVDLLETGVALYGIYRSSKRIMEQLYQTIGPTSAGNNMLTAACSLCQCHDKFTREEHSQVKVRSSFCHPLSREGRDILNTLECDHNSPSLSLSSNTQSMPTIQNVLVVPSSPRYWSTSVLPYGPTKLNFIDATRNKRSHEKNAIAAVPSVQHITSLRKSLASLFTIECMVLAEYVEFIIPLLYGNYVLMMVRLPSAKYHSELSGVTIENAGSTVKTIFIYGLLEFGSFILLMMLLKRGCGMQALHHLAFVLETQMLPIQSKIIGWMLITLGFRVVHFGTFTTDKLWIFSNNSELILLLY
ncbi:Hypothetical protein PHPALM_12709 [Phytophthora palmivora]|uniref:Transmembrane protein n=1 Tax=Phytophthora palmivora TaxID=4796 RepID=A0A2P4XZ21_9STRA|nr:Hypothetical protein PHPALM_12709 [Phytophthora palmivora]